MFLIVVSPSSVLNAMTTCVLNFVFGEHAHRYVGFVLKKLQDLSSIPGNLLSLKRGMFFFCKSVESLTEHEWVPGSHVTIE